MDAVGKGSDGRGIITRNGVGKRAGERVIAMVVVAMVLVGLAVGCPDPLSMEGSGTALDPFIVVSAEQLANIGADMDAYYRQAGDIDLAGFNNGVWVPIGDDYDDEFTGEFDGNGFEIRNLATVDIGVGFLYAVGAGGSLKNITLKDPDVTYANVAWGENDSFAGFFAGKSAGTISDCKVVSGNLDVPDFGHVGSLIGYMGGGSIELCSVSSTAVTGKMYVGGLVGAIGQPSTISRSCFSGTVTGTYDLDKCDAGGLVGLLNSAGVTLANCYAAATVTGENTAGIGGLVGTASAGSGADPTVLMTNSYFQGEISSPDDPHGAVFGRFVNGFYTGPASNVYYDAAFTGADTIPSLAYGTAKTAADLKQQATFNTWDFTTIWQIDEGVSSPTLRNM